tara:strand:+ start:11797 stop:12132 length:336 start_codon:yes stop_codon:yes gene_type:complete
MRNRPDGLEPEGRISRENKERYLNRAKAEVKTLKYYFSEEWFDKAYSRKVNITRGRLKKRISTYPLSKCPSCKKTWNFYHQRSKNKQQKAVQYWDEYERLPKIEVTCPNCQ